MARATVNLVDNDEGRAGGSEAGSGRPVQAVVFQKLGELDLPRLIATRVYPDRRLRRPHLGKHAVPGQTLEAIAATEPVDRELALPSVDLERKQVLPFGAADVEEGHSAVLSAEGQKRIVVYRHVPVERG